MSELLFVALICNELTISYLQKVNRVLSYNTIHNSINTKIGILEATASSFENDIKSFESLSVRTGDVADGKAYDARNALISIRNEIATLKNTKEQLRGKIKELKPHKERLLD